MQVICSHCRAKFNIPDDKIPAGRQVSVACPKCKQRIVVERSKGEEEDSSKQSAVVKVSAGYEYRDVDEVLELTIGEGEKVALLMAADHQEASLIKQAVKEVGYRVIAAEDTRDAMNKMRFHHFPMILLSDGFDATEIFQSPILRYLEHLAMPVRRRIFLVLIGRRFKSMDHMKAFAMSANLVINKNDLKKLAPILSRALADHESFYKVFMETLKEVGKA